MNKNLLPTGTIALAVLSGLTILPSCKDKQGAAQMQMPTPDVQVTELIRKDVPVTQEWVGSLRGTEDSDIRPQVSGYLLSKNYRNGSYVQKDQVLFQIDPRPFEAALEQARGALAQDKANAERFALDVQRYTPLVATGSVSRKQLDDAILSLKQAEASIKTSEARVADAEINLKFTTITAPFSGFAGIANPSLGDLLSPSSQEPLTTISAINPIRVDYSINEKDLLDTFSEVPGNPEDAKFEVVLANGKTFNQKGQPVAIDRNINRETGTINIVGEIPNPDLMLRPGMFVRVRAVTKMLKDAYLVPARAILKNQSMNFVVGVKPDNIPFMMPVKLGPVYDHMQVIEPIQGGFPEKMTVVVEGIQQAAMRQGQAPVNPLPYVYHESQPTINSNAISNFDENGKLKTPDQENADQSNSQPDAK
jgi:membrane fusion protein (multidrug efflux system)